MIKPNDLELIGEDEVGPVTVCRSNAGYYIGRMYWDPQFNCLLPYSRMSQEYFGTVEEANEALATGQYKKRTWA